MYIGRLGDGSHPDDGIYVMLKEVIDNSVDEFIMKNGKKILIDIDEAADKVSVQGFRPRHSLGEGHRMRKPDQYRG